MNKAFITGNLGRDPELRFAQNGSPILTLSVATNDRVKKNGEWQNQATWHKVVCFGKRAEGLNKFLTKGHTVAVTGRIENRTYEKSDGTKGFSTSILADDVEAIGKPQGTHNSRNDDRGGYESSGGYDGAGDAQGRQEEFGDDDIPF